MFLIVRSYRTIYTYGSRFLISPYISTNTIFIYTLYIVRLTNRSATITNARLALINL